MAHVALGNTRFQVEVRAIEPSQVRLVEEYAFAGDVDERDVGAEVAILRSGRHAVGSASWAELMAPASVCARVTAASR